MTTDFPIKALPLAELKPHPRNYKSHPDDQLEHIMQSIRDHGMYRNIVVAQDGTILAGHGVVEALQRLGQTSAPVIQLDIDPLSPSALKVLAGDNYISELGVIDDRMLTEILKEIKDMDLDTGLLGTGFDEMMLANLVYVSRPEDEIRDINAAQHWVGLPAYESGESSQPVKLIVSFRSEADREQFVSSTNIKIDKREAQTWTTRWPYTEREDLRNIRFE